MERICEGAFEFDHCPVVSPCGASWLGTVEGGELIAGATLRLRNNKIDAATTPVATSASWVSCFTADLGREMHEHGHRHPDSRLAMSRMLVHV